MAPLIEGATPTLEPSIVEVLEERRKNRPSQKGIKEKIVFNQSSRTMASVEYPFLVKDINEALTHFGRKPEWDQLFDGDVQNTSVPFYFDRRPTGRPTMSSNVATSNVVIKITVPKRTGRRRRKGTNDPWVYPSPKRKLDEDAGDDDPELKRHQKGDHLAGEYLPGSVPIGVQTTEGSSRAQRSEFGSYTPGLANPSDMEEERSDFENGQQRKRLYQQSQMIKPRTMLRILRDNIGRYRLEGIGNVAHTHRFRSLADFDLDMSDSRFMNNFIDKVLNGTVKTMREFQLEVDPPQQPGGDIIAPPQFTNLALPFQYFYEQNPYVRINAPDKGKNAQGEDEEDASELDEDDWKLINVQKNKMINKSFFISHNHVGVPEETVADWPETPDPELLSLVLEIQNLLQDRPIWTRRSLFNALRIDVRSWDLFKRAIQFVAYQFRSGPWHNAVIRFGIDPRTDPQYRKYQTLQFKLQRKGERPRKRRHRHVPPDEARAPRGAQPDMFYPSRELHHTENKCGDDGEMVNRDVDDGDGNSVFSDESGEAEPKPSRSTKRYFHDGNPDSHMFDGKEYSSSGRVWQVCDITDPLLARLLSRAEVRPTCSTGNSGWYHAGVWKKVKNIMRIKMIGIRFKKPIRDEDFDRVIHEYPDRTPPPDQKIPYFLLPNLHLNQEEMVELQGDMRWRRNLRPTRGMKYSEKDGTVELVSDQIPGFASITQDGGELPKHRGHGLAGSKPSRTDTENGSGIGRTEGQRDEMSGVEMHPGPGVDSQTNSSQVQQHEEPYSTSVNQDNFLAELSDDDSEHSNSDKGDDDDGEADNADDEEDEAAAFGDSYGELESENDEADEDEEDNDYDDGDDEEALDDDGEEVDEEEYDDEEGEEGEEDEEEEVEDSDAMDVDSESSDGFETVPGGAVPPIAGPSGGPPAQPRESEEIEEQIMAELMGLKR